MKDKARREQDWAVMLLIRPLWRERGEPSGEDTKAITTSTSKRLDLRHKWAKRRQLS